MAMPPSSSTSSVLCGFTYDVFLSFRGEDTRYGFTGNLRKALHDRGIRTFMDDEELRKGEEITPSLLKAIQQSRIAIIVLSKNYASSSFCLEELSKILDCIKGKGRFVWPVFYDVNPCEVRSLTGTYGEAMAKHEKKSNDNTERLQKWKKALQQVANLIGFHFKNGDGYEHEFIGKIVERVSREIKPITLHVADHLVGLESRMQNVPLLLDVGSDDRVHMVGIHGIGGIGKTTLAQAVYNFIAHQFECSCFLENVRENSEKHGLLNLQRTLLSEIVGEKKIELTNVKQGISILKQRLQLKKVLLILDDVDKREQLQAIVGRPEWFGPGSRVIITTRDKHLLTCHGVESTYEVNELDEKHAFELLRRKAFETDKVSPSYANVLKRAVTYASGLPLALEVIGSHLFKKGIEEWESALDRYERIPNKEILKILGVSFDALDEEEKSVFLDIACCFQGYRLAWVETRLHAHYGDSKKDHIGVLVEKSLIKVSKSGYVTLHDLIEDMGKEIVRRESPEEPGKRTRLWSTEDIVQIFEENSGTSTIQTIQLDSQIEVKWDGEAFKKMENLRTLIIKDCHFSESPKHLPNSLRILEWWNYPSSGLPTDFYPKKLAICDLSFGCFTSFMPGDLFKKKFENMRVLNLAYCDFLTQISNLSGLQNLEEFSTEQCYKLTTIDDSVGLLDKLKILRVVGCSKLSSIPPLKLASLEELDLSNCESLESFPIVVDGLLNKLKILTIKGCSELRSIPPLKLASLESLLLSDCESLESFPPVVDGLLDKLQILRVNGCSKLSSIPPLKLASLEQLDLSNCESLESFPPLVDGLLSKLKILTVGGCSKLRSIPPLKLTSLEELDLSYCESLESFPSVGDGLLDKLKILRANDCSKLSSIPPLKLASLEQLDLSDCESLESFPPVVDGLLSKLKILTVKGCSKLSSIPPLKLASLEELDLSNCESLESFPPVVDGLLSKLKILTVKGCSKLSSIPPLKLTSLEELDLSYCESLESFPSVGDGLLDKLQILRVNGCSKLSSIPPLKLASLQQLDLLDCESLESFPPVVDGLLSKLKGLTVEGCSKLSSIPPLKLASLERLYLSYCESIESFPPVVDGLLDELKILMVNGCSKLSSIPPLKLASLEQLYLLYCESIESFPAVVDGLLDKLKILWVYGCSKLSSIPPLKLASLEELNLSNCESLESFPPVVDGLLSKLKILTIKGCSELRSIPPLKLASLESLLLSDCESLESFPPVVDGLLDKLQILRVNGCSKLSSIPPLKLASLEQLDLSNCESLESFPPVVDGLLSKLKILTIKGCSELRSIPPLKLASLESLLLSDCESLLSFPPVVDGLLDKLQILRVNGCSKLSSIPPLKLASLEQLDLSNCESLESFPPVVDGLLSKLKILTVKGCSELRSIPPLKLASLESLLLSDCESLESFPPVVDGLLDKLQILRVNGCSKLSSIPPLKLASLEQLDLSNCESLESFPPVVDGLLSKLKILTVKGCSKLSSIPPLKLASLEQFDLSNCESLESFPLVVDGLLSKLKILTVKGCSKLNSIPPLKLTSLEQLYLSYCASLESFPEILGEVENITQLHLDNTPIKVLPFSFQNFTRLKTLYLENCGIVQLPSSIVVMSELVELTIKDGGLLFPKQGEGEEKVCPMQSSQVEFLHLLTCNLSYECLAIGLWFANVKELYLSWSKFTVLPECIEKCHFLWKLVLDNCEELQEIMGIPPSLKTLSAFNCMSLTSSCKSKLLNQELHEAGNIGILLPHEIIPEWFDHQCMEGLSISFRFRDKFPAIALCVISPLTRFNSQSHVRVIINGNTFFYRDGENKYAQRTMYHLHLFHVHMENFNDNLDEKLLENKWNHAEVVFEFPFQKSGIHVLKEKSTVKDIRSTNPENDVNIELTL